VQGPDKSYSAIAPASELAIEVGCTCCSKTNNNGAGINNDYLEYALDMYCPIHKAVVMCAIETDDETY
jgi:hypothetical protein